MMRFASDGQVVFYLFFSHFYFYFYIFYITIFIYLFLYVLFFPVQVTERGGKKRWVALPVDYNLLIRSKNLDSWDIFSLSLAQREIKVTTYLSHDYNVTEMWSLQNRRLGNVLMLSQKFLILE